MTELTSLHLPRVLHRNAALKAKHIHGLLMRLQTHSVLFPHEVALARCTEKAYFRQLEVEDISDMDITEEFNDAFPEREIIEGREHIVVRPFFQTKPNPALLSDLCLGYRPGSASDLKGLAVEVPPFMAEEPSHVSEYELKVLNKHHLGGTLSIANAMRHLSTTFNYYNFLLESESFLGKDFWSLEPVVSQETLRLVMQIRKELVLPFGPAVAEHFSSDSDSVNKLKALPAPLEELSNYFSKTA